MKTNLINFKSPAMISFLLVLPFIVMELIHRQNTQEGFPFMLFGFLWVLSLLFLMIGIPMVRNLRAGNTMVAHPLNLVIRLLILASLASLWVGLVMDQMPCFLGVPNCD